MNTRTILFFGAIIVGPLAMAQESKPVPAYETYMPYCMAQAEASEPEGVFGSSIHRGFAEAMCQCKFEHFPPNGVITKNEFYNSGLTCLREQQDDILEFTIQYLDRVQDSVW